MTNSVFYPIAVIVVTALVTWTLRAFPFLVFGNRPLPEMVHYLGKILPPAIMTVLVIYCLRETSFTQYPFGIPEIIASFLVIGLQWIRGNMYLSIVTGTVCYMILIHLL